jgi:sugar (pentulose or hexulose) kinase
MSHIAVFDVGKTNVKLLVVTGEGEVLDTRSMPNPVVGHDAIRRHDLAATEAFLLETLSGFGRRHPIGSFVTSGHGSAGVLVSAADLERPEPLCPMVDYEQAIPDWLDAAYRAESGGFEDRGSAVMLGATHPARQMLWVERDMPEQFAAAQWFLGLPQYWAWRLSGVPASEITYLSAQSDLWNLRVRRPSRIIAGRGWQHLLPPVRPAWDSLGPIRREIAEATGLRRDVRVLTGVHDSSANFYDYQALGLDRITVISTGTWIVGLSDHAALDRLDPGRGMSLNSDVFGEPVGGILTMGGREFSAVAGANPPEAPASPRDIARLVARGTMALPSFGSDDGPFAGSAGRGRILGGEELGPVERKALAVLYCALLTDACLTALGHDGTAILDGSFLGDPAFARLVAALRPGETVLLNPRADGVARGAARLASHGTPRPVAELPPRADPLPVPGLADYARHWRDRIRDTTMETMS